MYKFIQMTGYAVLLLMLSLAMATNSEAAKNSKKTAVKAKTVAKSSAKPVVVKKAAPKKPAVAAKSPTTNTKAAVTKQLNKMSLPSKVVAEKPVVAKVQSSPEVAERRTRIDFEDLLIQGQLKKADTVYLFERGENQLRSLVKKKQNFREEIYQNYLN